MDLKNTFDVLERKISQFNLCFYFSQRKPQKQIWTANNICTWSSFSFHRGILVSSSSLTLQMGRRAWLLPIWDSALCTWHLVPRAWHLDSPEKTPDLKTQTLVDSCEAQPFGLEPAFANCCRRQVWSGIVHSVLYLNLLVHLGKTIMKKKKNDKNKPLQERYRTPKPGSLSWFWCLANTKTSTYFGSGSRKRKLDLISLFSYDTIRSSLST